MEVRSQIALLHRGLGFGATASELDALTALGYKAAVGRLLDVGAKDGADLLGEPKIAPYTPFAKAIATPEGKQQLRDDAQTLLRWWIDRMVVSSRPAVEKLTLVWHGHFATGATKVRSPALMYQQNRTFRQLGLGSFSALALAVAKDPAMMIWLDTFQDQKGKPNENFARELMELFTMGIGTYSEADVKEAARCFTGWSLDRQSGQYVFRPALHDSAAKTLLGERAQTGEDAIAIVTAGAHCARFITARLWSRLARPVSVDDPVVAELAPAFASHGNITELVRSIVMHPTFVADSTVNGLVKQPVEWLVGSLRVLGLRMGPAAEEANLRDMGQVPFDPPSVAGWPPNGYWINSATALARLQLATRLARRADLGALSAVSAPSRPDFLAHLLGIDGWSASSAKAIATGTPTESLTIALVSPEYVLA
ncbi:MAG: hypothetical protein JWL70_1436 [Acidimicrobiia bacterium]|nr:hypothetical protein [Acidimicrobiia bacterium]